MQQDFINSCYDLESASQQSVSTPYLLDIIRDFGYRFHENIHTIVALYLIRQSSDTEMHVSDVLLEETYIKYPNIVFEYFKSCVNVCENKKLYVVRYWYKKLGIVPSETTMQMHLMFYKLSLEIIEFYLNFYDSALVFKYVRVVDHIPSQHDTLQYADEYIKICREYNIINSDLYNVILMLLSGGRVSPMLAYELIRIYNENH